MVTKYSIGYRKNSNEEINQTKNQDKIALDIRYSTLGLCRISVPVVCWIFGWILNMANISYLKYNSLFVKEIRVGLDIRRDIQPV